MKFICTYPKGSSRLLHKALKVWKFLFLDTLMPLKFWHQLLHPGYLCFQVEKDCHQYCHYMDLLVLYCYIYRVNYSE